MIIGHPRRTNKVEVHETLRLNGSDIRPVKKTKSLGVIVEEGLNWEEQFKTVKGKVHGRLTSLKKLKNILPQSQLSNVYRALVESHMRYADVIWGHLSNSKTESLQRLQDRAISIIETSRIKDELSHNFLHTEQLVLFDRAVMAYKIMNRLCPENLWNKFQRRSQLQHAILQTPATTRDSAEIFRFRSIIWSMSKKDFPIQLLRSGMKSQ